MYYVLRIGTGTDLYETATTYDKAVKIKDEFIAKMTSCHVCEYDTESNSVWNGKSKFGYETYDLLALIEDGDDLPINRVIIYDDVETRDQVRIINKAIIDYYIYHCSFEPSQTDTLKMYLDLYNKYL